MAIKLEEQYPGVTIPASINYPWGSFKNETVKDAKDGTPYELAWSNDIYGFYGALLKEPGITPTGVSDTAVASQYLDAVKLFSKADRKHVQVANAVAAPTTKVTIEPCAVWDRTRTTIINLQSALTKNITGVWVPGNDVGGRISAALSADTGYHFFVIKDSLGNVDAGFDTAHDASNLLTQTGYTYAARISYYHTQLSSTDLLTTYKNGDIFTWGANWLDFADITIPSGINNYEDVPILTPGGVKTEAKVTFTMDTVSTTVTELQLKEQIGTALGRTVLYIPNSDFNNQVGNTDIITNENSEIEWRVLLNLPASISLAAYGWRDFLGNS